MLTISLLVSLCSRHERFRAVWEQRTRNESQRPRKRWGEQKSGESFHFSRGQTRKSRSSSFLLCLETTRKRLLRKLSLGFQSRWLLLHVVVFFYFYKPKAIYEMVCQITLLFSACSYYNVRRITFFSAFRKSFFFNCFPNLECSSRT